MARSLRLFVAVELPEEVLAHLTRIMARLRGQVPSGVQWVRPAGLHLTLKFLGNVPEEKLPSIVRAMEAAAFGVGPFTLHIRGAGVFPGPQAPRVVWLGVEGDLPPLRALQERLEEDLARVGFPRELRAFSPHLTVGRIRDRLPPSARQKLLQALDDLGRRESQELTVLALSLMESELAPGGAIYRRRASVPLPGASGQATFVS
ncbi:MAG: RNA 2',3'-cyclic phosphodiesterase [Chloroflexi bacterium]|nr:RNA 2',3'-cyclic phosphodiesterase [Chloroflexota bacterium]